MNFTFEIAKRYLLGKKSTNAVNIITWISVVGMTIGTAALILILSVFNGFEFLLAGLSNSFNPDMKISLVEGKYFEIEDDDLKKLSEIEGIVQISKTIEEVCFYEYKDAQKAGMIKGVDEYFSSVTSIDSTIKKGEFKLLGNNRNYGVLGRGLSINLSINSKDVITPIFVHMFNLNAKGITGKLGKETKSISVYPAGVFSVGSDADVKYVITNLESVNKLLDREDMMSALEIKLDDDHNEDQIRAQITGVLGEGYKIKNRYDQEESFLKVMKFEKWISFLIVSLTLIIIAFNMVGSLWMIVLEKKKDISILRSMGYETKQVRSVFMMVGMIISMIGIVIGIIVALILYFLQSRYGLVSIPEGFLIDAYPIELKFMDFIVVIITVFLIGWLASLLPSYRAGKVSPFVRQEL